MLAIEIDGISHPNQEKFDKKRQEKLENMGIKFLRFEDDLVNYNLPKVLNEIEKRINDNSPCYLDKTGYFE